MKVRSVRRFGAAAVLAVCMIVFVAQAAADENQFLAISSASANEGSGNVTFTVTLSDGNSPSATVDFATADGSATAGDDYTATSTNITVPAGGSTTVDVPITDDSLDETNENFTANLSNPVDASLGSSSASGTIVDNDASPSLAISGPTNVDEDDGTATYSVAISGNQSANTVSVNYTAASGTATSGSDFTPASGSLSWPSGDTTAKPITVSITNDSLDENDENFSVNLSGASGATIADGNAGTTITDNDAEPTTGAFANVSTPEGSANHNLGFTVNLSAVSGKNVTVNYSTAPGSATAPSDYISQVGQNVVIPAGQLSATIQIVIVGDTEPEPDESFTVNLNSATNATLGTDTQATGTITNDDSGVTASITDVTLAEGNSGTTNFVFNVQLSGPAPAAGSITWRTASGSATSPADYDDQPNTIQPIAQNATGFQITIAVVGDNVPEGNDTFFVDLISATGPISISADSRGTGTINNDDSGVTASITDVTLAEGNSGTTNFVFNVQLSGPAPAAGSITWRTASGSATSPADYDDQPNTIQPIAQNATGFQITIAVVGDNVPEGNDTFFVDLVGSTGPISISADNRGTGTINNDDSGVTASINDVTVVEGNSPNTVNATFTVSLSGPAPAPVTITYRTVDGSAGSPADYTGVPNTILNIGQGASSGQLTIVVKGDALPEGPSENFFVDLINTTGPVTISGDSRGTGTITDDDSPVTASINDVAVTEGNTGTTVNATFTVSLSGAAAAPLEIRYSTVNGSAVAPGDYTTKTNALLPIAQGATSGQFSIVVNGDGIPEGTGSPLAESFFVDLISTTGPATISADSRGIGSIVDNDSPVTASINDVSVIEGNTGTTANATFTVTLSGPAPAPVQIRYSTVNGSAVSPSDYTGLTNALLNIGEGSSSGQFIIVVKGDVVPEGAGSPLAEDFFVDLISTTGPATISADSRGIGSIVDNDSPVTASINDVSVTEGNAATVNATFTVALSGPAQAPLQIRYSTLNSSAVAPGDFTAVTNALLPIAQGATSGQFSIVVNGDVVLEGSGDPRAEDFFVDLISATGPVTISADSRGRGTIIDDEPAPPGGGGGGGGGGNAPLPLLSISDTLAREGVDANFTVTLTGNTTKTVTVRLQTSNATALGGSDFVSRTEVLNFAPGETTKTIALTILDDTLPEGIESFLVRLSDATNATITKNVGTGTIEANDQVTPAGGNGPNSQPTGATLPQMVLGPPSLTVGANGIALMRVTCAKTSPIACVGLVALETTVKPKFQLGKKNFVAKKGKRTSVQIKLSARALKRLMQTGTLKVRAIVVVRNSKKKTLRFVPGVVTLKASKALATKLSAEKTLDVKAKDATAVGTTPTPTATATAKPKPKPEPEPKIIIDP